MTWIPLLLADRSPCLRLLVLRELLDRPEDDPEVQELHALRESDPLAASLLQTQQQDGSWTSGVIPGTGSKSTLRTTIQALARLGYLGFKREHPAVALGAGYVFSRQREDSSWPLPGEEERDELEWGRTRYDRMPMQTALPLRSLALCGYAEDPRAEKAYQWLLDQRLEDGAFPVGVSAGVYGRIAGYRRIAHSRWGCRTNTTAALICLALHPQQRQGPEARRALDLLLGRETREREAIGFEVARLVGVEPVRGFTTYYGRFDLALILDLCWRVGVSRDDMRLADLVRYLQEQQGEFGLWEYPRAPQASRWVTFDLLRSPSRLDEKGNWIGLEPRTPFQPYPSRTKRF